MTCPMESRVSQLHDGELSPAELAEVQAHLGGCEACRAALRAYRRMSAVFDHAEPVRFAPEARLELRRRLLRSARWGVAARWARPVAVAAAMILALGIPLLVWTPAESTSPLTAGQASSATASVLPLPTGWETTFLTRDAEPVAREFPQVQFADFVAWDLAQSRR